MFAATRRWLRRNRTPIAIGVGVAGAVYVATQYVVSKINDARERMTSERIAKENLRRRFEQNQEDCTYTVLALMPTATKHILELMNTEKITLEIQQAKGGRTPASSAASPPSIADTTLTDEDGRSLTSDSGVHASQISVPSPVAATGDGAQDGGVAATAAPGPQRGQRKSKRQLWDELTISSITRSFTLVYTLALLSVFTRVQLNLLGRRNYLSSVILLAAAPSQSTIRLQNNDDDEQQSAPDASSSDFDTNKKYLAFSWWILYRGCTDLGTRVEAAVRQVFGHLSPRDTLTFAQFGELVMSVRRLIEGKNADERAKAPWLPYLLPPSELELDVLREAGMLAGDNATESLDTAELSTAGVAGSAGVPKPASLRRLIDETADIVESPAFSYVLTLLLDAGFTHLVDDKLAMEAFELPPLVPAGFPGDSGVLGPMLTDPQGLRQTKAVLLPRILSVLTRQAHAIGSGMPNEYLHDMEKVHELASFAAVVYSSNWEVELQKDSLGGLGPSPEVSELTKGKEREKEKEAAKPSASFSEAVKPNAEDAAMESSTATISAVPPPGRAMTIEDSVVVVDSQASYESAWERAVNKT